MSLPREHRIRLQQAWTLTPLRDVLGNSIDGQSVRAAIGQNWQKDLNGFLGTVRYERVFHPPQNLRSDETVDLIVEAIAGRACITLNEVCLVENQHLSGAMRVNITNHLKPNSKLVIVVESGAELADSGYGVTGMVWLAISGDHAS